MNATTKTPNIEKLARLIVRTGNADKIMTVLAVSLAPTSATSATSAKEGGQQA